jgi:UDP-N-acetylglucosamine 2-epimerase (non-hydrolysing)
VSVAGARPNFMKIAPVAAELSRFPDRFAPTIVHTGQHDETTTICKLP